MPTDRNQSRKRMTPEQRRKKRKRRKMFLLFRAVLRLLIIVVGLAIIGKLLFFGVDKLAESDFLNREGVFWQQEEGSYVAEAEANLIKPVKREKREIYRELEKLAKQDNDYKEIYENRESYPEALLGALCNNADMLSFVQGYLTYEGQGKVSLTKEEKAAEIPLLMQWDKRWGYVPYGNECVALLGCGTTSLSMVAIALTDNYEVTPDVVAEYAMKEGYYVEGSGTSWSMMTEGCEYFGLKGQEIALDEWVMRNHLQDGEYIICSMRPGDFTTLGHFIVLTGCEEGGFTIHDANSRERSQVIWSYETLKGQIKNLWAFSAK